MATATKQTQEQRGQDVNKAVSTSSGVQSQQSQQSTSSVDGARVDINEQESLQEEGLGEQTQIQRSHADITLSFRMKVNFDPSKRYRTDV